MIKNGLKRCKGGAGQTYRSHVIHVQSLVLVQSDEGEWTQRDVHMEMQLMLCMCDQLNGSGKLQRP